MEEIQAAKAEARETVAKAREALSEAEITGKTKTIENRLFEFANFLESNIVMMYMAGPSHVASRDMVKKCYEFNKIVVLPAFDANHFKMTLMKVDNLDTDLVTGPRGILEPNPRRCKVVPIDCIDIAIIPGVALDEKGGRVGSGQGYYDRFIPKLPITTRKVALALEAQIIPQAPMESHDKHVDIIITENRVIYKI
ncbi:MAG: 5-formyltetrahydrofolate cyclo-ligase [Desulfobacterales bacterium]|nr:5-formyltetrahydrofolate cyclo-ligase [Desulfobacterales bacterium]